MRVDAQNYIHSQNVLAKNFVMGRYKKRSDVVDLCLDLGRSQRAVLHALFDYIKDEEGWRGCFPSVEALARRAGGYSRRHTHRILNSLAEQGFIEWIRGESSFKTNVYKITPKLQEYDFVFEKGWIRNLNGNFTPHRPFARKNNSLELSKKSSDDVFTCDKMSHMTCDEMSHYINNIRVSKCKGKNTKKRAAGAALPLEEKVFELAVERKKAGNKPKTQNKIFKKTKNKKDEKKPPVVLRSTRHINLHDAKKNNENGESQMSKNNDWYEKQKEKAREYRKKAYERQKERLKEKKASGSTNAAPKEPKPTREVKKLFQFFLARCKESGRLPRSSTLDPITIRAGVLMLKDVKSMANAESLVEWAVQNWERLVDQDNRLEGEPSFYNITAKHRYGYYLKQATTSAKKKDTRSDGEKKTVEKFLTSFGRT